MMTRPGQTLVAMQMICVVVCLATKASVLTAESTESTREVEDQQQPRTAKIADVRNYNARTYTGAAYDRKYTDNKYDKTYPDSAYASSFVKDESNLTPVVVPYTTSSYNAQEKGYGSYAPGEVLNDVAVSPGRENDTARFISLTGATQDLQLGLQFTVPFVSLPLRTLLGSQSLDWSSLLQINWPSVLALGLLALAAIVVVPWLVSSLSGGSFPSYLNLSNYGRSDDGEEGAIPALMSRLDDTLHKYDMDSEACMQRALCTYVQKAAKSVREGTAGSTDLIVEGLASNTVVTSWLSDTALLKAAEVGRTGHSCAEKFTKCPISAASVYRALTKYLGASV